MWQSFNKLIRAPNFATNILKRKIVYPKMQSPAEDERNLELKARIPGGAADFERRLKIAEQLSGQSEELIVQRDVFFNSPQGGRLKLRYLQPPKRSQLVYYNRPDVAGPKLSLYNKIETDEPGLMEKVLGQSNGIQGILAKRRHLFIHKQTRIHIDEVEDLGHFMEFEVCLLPEQTLDEADLIVKQLQQTFDIKEQDLMTGSYFDELQRLKKKINSA